MSDTIQTVRWSLGMDGHLSSQFWLPDWREPIDDVLWKSIRRLGLEKRMRAAFHMSAALVRSLDRQSPDRRAMFTVAGCVNGSGPNRAELSRAHRRVHPGARPIGRVRRPATRRVDTARARRFRLGHDVRPLPTLQSRGLG